MTAAVCRSCRRTVDLEPLRCPYCTVVQPNRSFDPGKHYLWTALLGCLGLFAGLSGGYVAGAASMRGYPVAARGFARPARVIDPEAKKRALSASLRAALEQAARAGARSATGEDLVFGPATYADQRLVISGLLGFVDVKAGTARFRVSDRWGGQPFIGVEASLLPVETRKELLRKSWPPHVVVVRGFWRQGAFEGLGGELGHFLQAEEVAFIGELSGGQMKELR